MDNEFGLKELYDVVLKATYPIELGEKSFEEGEVVARFDKIQLANFKEVVSRVSANGGFDNRARVIWESTKEIQLNFTQGIFSKRQLSILQNAKLAINKKDSIFVSKHIKTESNESGSIYLENQKIGQIFVYDAKTLERIPITSTNYSEGIFKIKQPYQDVEVDYTYLYENGFSTLDIGQKAIKGFLSFEGKTKIKDDITGKTHTAILQIPQLKLVSDLSMRLGREASPVVMSLDAIGIPTGVRGNEKVMELFFLNDDIDAEI